jgi:F0F1-type ATP synthase assembly protein I
MVVVMLLGVFGGMWLDGKFGSEPAFVVTGTVLGIVLGMTVIIREVGRERR